MKLKTPVDRFLWSPFCFLGWLVSLWALAPGVAQAHNMRTVYLELTEVAPGKAWLFRKATIDDRSVKVHFAAGCQVQRTILNHFPPTSTYQINCPFALKGTIIRVRGMGPIIDEAVVRFQAHSSPNHTATKLLSENNDTWQLPRERDLWRVLFDYVGLGFTHILGGPDHLLFLLALLLLVHQPRAMFWTITAFTLSHSLTLGATTLGWIRVSAPAAEACIAWSLVLTARDVLRREQLSDPNTQGSWLGFVFGLIHGFGFAGSLREIGLPHQAIPVSLLGFNLGVEFGQLLLVLPCFALLKGLRDNASRASQWLQWLFAYGIGITGAFWFWQRLSLLF